jgi:hypothetical protein
MPQAKKRSPKTPRKTTTSRAKATKKKPRPAEKSKAKPKATEEPKTKQADFDEDNLGERLSVIAQKAYDAVKDGVQKLSDFASEGSQVAKMKFEILNLSSDRKSLLRDVGQKLWKLHKDKSLINIEEKFKKEFDKIAELEKQIAAKEKEMHAVSKKMGK